MYSSRRRNPLKNTRLEREYDKRHEELHRLDRNIVYIHQPYSLSSPRTYNSSSFALFAPSKNYVSFFRLYCLHVFEVVEMTNDRWSDFRSRRLGILTYTRAPHVRTTRRRRTYSQYNSHYMSNITRVCEENIELYFEYIQISRTYT